MVPGNEVDVCIVKHIKIPPPADLTLWDWAIQTSHHTLRALALIALGSVFSIYGLLWSRWLDVGRVLSLRVYIHKHTKLEWGQYPAILTEQAWSIKDLLHGINLQNMINFPCETEPVSRAPGQDSSNLRARVANHSARFILPAHGASHIKRHGIYMLFAGG